MDLFILDQLIALGIGFLLGVIVVGALLWVFDDWA